MKNGRNFIPITRKRSPTKTKLFRFEPMWMRHGDYSELIKKWWAEGSSSGGSLVDKLIKCKEELTRWNSKTFGNVSKRISELKKSIEGLKNQFRSRESIEKEADMSK
ncbi:hypothetical protein QQ045_018505 [Rhodiola kirilowii]